MCGGGGGGAHDCQCGSASDHSKVWIRDRQGRAVSVFGFRTKSAVKMQLAQSFTRSVIYIP